MEQIYWKGIFVAFGLLLLVGFFTEAPRKLTWTDVCTYGMLAVFWPLSSLWVIWEFLKKPITKLIDKIFYTDV